jgi:hypothetical protein
MTCRQRARTEVTSETTRKFLDFHLIPARHVAQQRHTVKRLATSHSADFGARRGGAFSAAHNVHEKLKEEFLRREDLDLLAFIPEFQKSRSKCLVSLRNWEAFFLPMSWAEVVPNFCDCCRAFLLSVTASALTRGARLQRSTRKEAPADVTKLPRVAGS